MTRHFSFASLFLFVCIAVAVPLLPLRRSNPVAIRTNQSMRNTQRRFASIRPRLSFNSPLTDYLPASPNVPTPKAVLGDVAGAPGKLPYAEEVYSYMRMLEKASPRVKVYSIGTTEEGREMIAVAVASENLLASSTRTAPGSRNLPIRARSI